MQPRRVSLYGSECVRWCPSGLESVRFGGRVSIPTSCHLFQLPLLNPQSTRATGGLNDSLKLFRVYTSLSIINQVNQATCDSDPKHQLLVPFVPLLIFNFAASQFLPARFLAPNGFCRLSNNRSLFARIWTSNPCQEDDVRKSKLDLGDLLHLAVST